MTMQNQEREANLWAMFLHLSLLGGYIIPFGGFIAPVIIWQLKKDELPILDIHGKMAVNWLISSLIYGAIFSCLTIVFIGIPLLALLGVLGVLFPIIAGIKANNSEFWKYPFSLTILK
ncbi:DUF4870 domain-containing protein [Mastigocoleus testarum]|nr:DUF4870 domain-containing protein [Mastigocoleus testarum]